MDALDHGAIGLDIERTAKPHGHPTNMNTGLLTAGHIRAHAVARLKVLDLLLTHEIRPRKTASRQARALVAASSRGLNGERRSLPVRELGKIAHTRCIERMGFRDAQSRSIEFSASTRGKFHRQTGGLQGFSQRPSRGIDGGRIL